MKFFSSLLLFSISCSFLNGQLTPFEISGKTKSATYDEVIGWWDEFAKQHPAECKLLNAGPSDSGKPVHLVILTGTCPENPAQAKKSGKKILLINNGIHPGEPDGIDASMLFAREILENPEWKPALENVIILIIPVYNIGGSLNRGCCYRANQNGPWPHGFRGNGQNLDLNRDFLKADALETQTFHKIIHSWNPDVFVDTHVTDGSDYPYVMTLIPTVRSKIPPPLAQYIDRILLPDLFKDMEAKGYPMAPYVNSIAEIPDSGIADFFDSPRYATGYTSLFNVIGFTTETHMLKPFPQRVDATYTFLTQILKLVSRDKAQITRARTQAAEFVSKQKTFALNWELDKNHSEKFHFSGYKAEWKPGALTGIPTASYDQNQTWESDIPWLRDYLPKDSTECPVAYVLPQAWREVAARMKNNNVEMKTLSEDVEIEVDVQYIKEYNTSPRAYEGHYLHSSIKTETKSQKIRYQAGDFVIYTNQPNKRYIIESLEPVAEDSWFAWNFFDGILMQKEYFSSWLFESKAAEILNGNPALKEEFEKKKTSDPDFAQNQRQQLDFVYKHSDWYEATHNRYPVTRLMKNEKLPLAR